MADVTRRIANWDVKFNVERVKSVLDEKRAAMLEHYVDAMVKLASMEGKVKQLLDGAGVQSMNYVWYIDFARQLYRLNRTREMSGDSFTLASDVLLEKWAARGLDREVLAAIRSQVFNAPDVA
jgi:hypothetical protein